MRVQSWCCTCYRFGQMYDVPVIKGHTGSSHCLENPLCSACSLPTPGTAHPIPYCPHGCAFSRASRGWTVHCAAFQMTFPLPNTHPRALRVSLGLVANFSLLLMENRFSTALFSGERSSPFLLQRRRSLRLMCARGAYPLQPASSCASESLCRGPLDPQPELLRPTGAMWLVPWLFIELAIWFPIYS